MQTFKENILKQIEKIEIGKIFTTDDLNFPIEKLGQVNNILSTQNRNGALDKIENGAYYKAKTSKLGLGKTSPYPTELLRYLTKKLNGYTTGLNIYNLMNFTEQVPNIITIATPKTIQKFKFKFDYLNIECVKAYCNKIDNDETIFYLRLLDVMKDIKNIPARSEQNVYESLRKNYINKLNKKQIKKISELAQEYPPRVRKILSDILYDLGYKKLETELKNTLLPTTKFNLKYRKYESA
ncbi:MAG: hypothetical protein LBT27_03885 [Prevotellaceae bacterium]|jgi:hypothetical protein|nr:hypothetical protein [Prevotellaceae bacterium]